MVVLWMDLMEFFEGVDGWERGFGGMGWWGWKRLEGEGGGGGGGGGGMEIERQMWLMKKESKSCLWRIENGLDSME